MNITRFVILLAVVYSYNFTNITHAQEIEIHPDSETYLYCQEIDTDNHQLLSNNKLNIRLDQLFIGYTNEDGSLIYIDYLAKKLLKQAEDGFKLIDTPLLDSNEYSGAELSQDGKWLIIKEGGINPDRFLHFYNIEQKKIVFEHRIGNSGFVLNRDATVIAYLDEELYVINRHDDQWTTSLVAEGLSFLKFISSSGDRIFYTTSEKSFTLDKTENGWSEPNEIAYDDENNFIPVKSTNLAAIANNGKTLLIGNIDVELSIIEEINGQWQKPQPIGYQLNIGDNVHISNDGNVIAVSSVLNEEDMINRNLYVFMKNVQNEWIRHQVNPHSVSAKLGMILSGDGTKLYWIPSENISSTIPNALKLHRSRNYSGR